MASQSPPILDFKSATLYAVRLVLLSADTAALLSALRQRLDEAGDFFDGEPVVIDANGIASPPDWSQIAAMLQSANMPVAGVTAASTLHDGIRAAGLWPVSLPGGREASPSLAAHAAEADATASIHRDPPDAGVACADPAQHTLPDMEPPAAELVAQHGLADRAAPVQSGAAHEGPRTTMILDRSLRSGQKVYARGADLVVVGMVSPGAEVIADGSIHVYGPLRGKAMAGARGDETARIFTTRLDAELVAVAGVYRVVETALPAEVRERPAAVRLRDGELRIEPLNI